MRTDFGEKLRALRKQRDYNQTEVSRLMTERGCQIAKQSISRWEQGLNMPNAVQFINLCVIYQVKDVAAVFGEGPIPSPANVLNREGRKKVDEYIKDLAASGLYSPETSILLFPKRKAPLYMLPASAGTGQFLDSSDYEMVEIDDPMAQNANFGVRISGNSMEPQFHDGGIAWVQQQQDIENGEVGIFLLNGDAFIKLFRRTAEKCQLISLNPAYPPKDIHEEDDFRVFGKVLH